MHPKSMFQTFQDFEFATYKNWKGIFIFQIFESQNWTVFNKIWKYIYHQIEASTADSYSATGTQTTIDILSHEYKPNYLSKIN